MQTYKLPSLDFEHVATRFSLPVRAVAFSPCGEKLAAAGDDDGIKLVTIADQKVGPLDVTRVSASSRNHQISMYKPSTQSNWPYGHGFHHAFQVFKTLRAGPYTRALAWEQEGTYVASLSADGHLQVWDIVSGKADCNMPKSAPKVCICPSTCSELNFLPRSHKGSKMSLASLCQ